MKTALGILNLDGTASVADAKKAYRDLAKKYHPDVFEKKNGRQINAEAKMKQINLAFRHMVPLLKKKEARIKVKETRDGRETVKTGSMKHDTKRFVSFLTHIIKSWVSFFNKKRKNSRPLRGKPEKKIPINKFNRKVLRFHEVLKSVHPVPTDRQKKTGRPEKKRYPRSRSPYLGYQKYMALKTKLASGQSGRHQGIPIESVHKIEPVEPIPPVGKR
ncbi:DnaJ domain-containing protein [Desulfobacula sp.]|uniref:J domain-containing protein n=1 Tax=Desulfobacula sp. TaxID=2593537 RepID=UPI0026028AB8|nr:DnaJ domain-containing protein [Desulfobacula sp.]